MISLFANTHPFWRGSALVLVDSLISGGLTALFWLLAARLASPTEVGTTSAVISAASLIALICRFGFDFTIPYFFYKVKNPRRFLSIIFAISALGSVFLSLVMTWVFKYKHDSSYSILWEYGPYSWIILPLLSTTVLFTNFFLNIGKIVRKVNWVITQNIVQNGLRSVIFISSMPLTAINFIKCILSAQIISLIIGFIKLFPSPKNSSPKHFYASRHHVLNYAFKSYVGSLLATGTGMLMPVLVAFQLGPIQTAIFSICWMVTVGVSIPHTSMVSMAFSEGSRDFSSIITRINKSLIMSIVIFGFAATIFYTFGQQIFSLIGPDYTDTAPFLTFILLISMIPAAFNDFIMIILRIKNEFRSIYLIIGCQSIIFIALASLGMQKWGITFIGYSFLMSNLIAFAIATLFKKTALMYPKR